MCGIVGIKGYKGKDDLQQIAARAKAAMAHRGPDDDGSFFKNDIFLGHQRLAIIDLSPLGHQPMSNNNNDLHIAFNGEIYNYIDVRNKLSDYNFKSNSDTEVLLAAYEKWGIDFLQELNGMFAFALYDVKENKLIVARDRLGIKPLYYHHREDVFLFASEIRSLLATGLIKARVNTKVIREYFTYQTVHAPNTMLEDVYELLPGEYMIIDDSGLKISKYWNICDNVNDESQNQDYETVCKHTLEQLNAAVERRMISDVPLGAFLSGGIDSSAVVGLMSSMRDQPVKTFTIAFDEEEFSESKYANIIAKKFNTEHHEFRLKPSDFLHKLPEALKALDHPSGDGPNSYTVSQITRENGLNRCIEWIRW